MNPITFTTLIRRIPIQIDPNTLKVVTSTQVLLLDANIPSSHAYIGGRLVALPPGGAVMRGIKVCQDDYVAASDKYMTFLCMEGQSYLCSIDQLLQAADFINPDA